MGNLIEKLKEIISLLKIKKNKSFIFFEELILLIQKGEESLAISNMLASGAIIQYGDFDNQQVEKYKELYAISKEINMG